MAKKTQISDFRFQFLSAGHYSITYTSPVTDKEFRIVTTDMQIVDEFKGTETNDHTHKRLNWLKSYIKNY